MHVAISDAGDALIDLVRRVQDGEYVVLTQEGRPVVRLSPVRGTPTPAERRVALDRAMAEADRLREPGLSGAELQDSLYDEDGLPA